MKIQLSIFLISILLISSNFAQERQNCIQRPQNNGAYVFTYDKLQNTLNKPVKVVGEITEEAMKFSEGSVAESSTFNLSSGKTTVSVNLKATEEGSIFFLENEHMNPQDYYQIYIGHFLSGDQKTYIFLNHNINGQVGNEYNDIYFYDDWLIDTWYHLVVVVNDDGSLEMYKDGVQLTNIFRQDTQINSGLPNSEYKIKVESKENEGDPFIGEFEEFVVYDGLLGIDEIICLSDECNCELEEKCKESSENCFSEEQDCSQIQDPLQCVSSDLECDWYDSLCISKTCTDVAFLVGNVNMSSPINQYLPGEFLTTYLAQGIENIQEVLQSDCLEIVPHISPNEGQQGKVLQLYNQPSELGVSQEVGYYFNLEDVYNYCIPLETEGEYVCGITIQFLLLPNEKLLLELIIVQNVYIDTQTEASMVIEILSVTQNGDEPEPIEISYPSQLTLKTDNSFSIDYNYENPIYIGDSLHILQSLIDEEQKELHYLSFLNAYLENDSSLLFIEPLEDPTLAADGSSLQLIFPAQVPGTFTLTVQCEVFSKLGRRQIFESKYTHRSLERSQEQVMSSVKFTIQEEDNNSEENTSSNLIFSIFSFIALILIMA